MITGVVLGWGLGGSWGGSCTAPKPHTYAEYAERGGRGGTCRQTRCNRTPAKSGEQLFPTHEGGGRGTKLVVGSSTTSTTPHGESPMNKPLLGVVVGVRLPPQAHPSTTPAYTEQRLIKEAAI